MKLIFLPVIVLVIITISVTGEKLIAQYHPKIDVVRDIDVCDSTAKTRLIFRVNIGRVYYSDSLYGYDLEIRYNPDKIKMINYYTGNTLSEFFEEKSFSFGLNQLEDEGIIRGYATTFNFSKPPSAGDSILVAFGAEWLGNCEDTASLEILELNFTDEFKKKLSDTFDTGIINAYPFENASRFASFTSDKYDVLLKDNETNFNLNFNVKLPANYYADNLLLEFTDSPFITINDVQVDNENVISDQEGNSVTLHLMNKVNEFNLSLNCEYILKDTISGLKYRLEKVTIPECSCILGYGTDSVSITKDSTIVGMQEFTNNDYLESEDDILINNQNYDIQKILVMDVLGRIIQEIDTRDKAQIKIFKKEVLNKVFFIGIYRKQLIEIKKFYKCY
ncbi:MAG: hypothetical protein A2X64_07995 [Ignavibacteria bacterium GWF2_33_9]|nr:MAG: hypothetical protein A2X64_07995 [Ignavibacteria bacterium GWF2_33_9]